MFLAIFFSNHREKNHGYSEQRVFKAIFRFLFVIFADNWLVWELRRRGSRLQGQRRRKTKDFSIPSKTNSSLDQISSIRQSLVSRYGHQIWPFFSYFCLGFYNKLIINDFWMDLIVFFFSFLSHRVERVHFGQKHKNLNVRFISLISSCALFFCIIFVWVWMCICSIIIALSWGFFFFVKNSMRFM